MKAVERDALHAFVHRAWDCFEAANQGTAQCVVQPSMPILHFGDLDRYWRSDPKVVTVGLNPSSAEFPAEDPWMRFRQAPSRRPTTLEQVHAYVASLNSYFRPNSAPYNRWFRPSYESLLLGMGASYYGKAKATALHTDICSPVATSPTWSGLRGQRDELIKMGLPLWREWIRFLEPDVLVVSVARAHLEEIDLPMENFEILHTIRRKRPYVFEVARCQLGTRASLLVFGQASQTPFGSVAGLDKQRVGSMVLARLGTLR